MQTAFAKPVPHFSLPAGMKNTGWKTENLEEKFCRYEKTSYLYTNSTRLHPIRTAGESFFLYKNEQTGLLNYRSDYIA
jgi:hypothetical protein